MTFILEPPDEPFFNDLHWLKSIFFRWVIDIGIRKSGGESFEFSQNGRIIGGFVRDHPL